MKFRNLLLLVLSLFILSGCQSNQANKEVPSTYLDLTNGDFDIEDYWIRENKNEGEKYSLFFPDELAKRSLKGCAEVIFGINSEGKLTGYKPVYSYPGEYVATAAGAHMMTFKWAPGVMNPNRRPILAKAYFTFEMENGSRNEAGFKKNCEGGFPPASN